MKFPKYTVYIRVDGNTKIGLGHLVRCIALAQMLDQVFRIVFVCVDIPVRITKDLFDLGYELLLVENESEFINEIDTFSIVVLDGYHFSVEFQKILKARCGKLICIDDLHATEFHADLIINHAPGVRSADYRAPSFTQYALGPEYVLLRRAFLNECRNKTTDTKGVALICFGGLDFQNLTLKTYKIVSRFKFVERIIIITGPAYNFGQLLHSEIKNNPRVSHLNSLSDIEMMDEMKSAELIFVPASGILLEALSVGKRIISGIYAPNQSVLFQRYKAENAFISAEDFSDNAIIDAIGQFLRNRRVAVKSYFDGNSGKRILRKVLELGSSFRRAEPGDCELLLDWANDSDVRANAINSNIITKENHQNWFYQRLREETCKIFIMKVLDREVGQIRYEKCESIWTIDYSLDVNFRGLGLGQVIIRNTLPLIEKGTVKAIVAWDNLTSQKVFQSMGFTKGTNKEICGRRFIDYQLKNK